MYVERITKTLREKGYVKYADVLDSFKEELVDMRFPCAICKDGVLKISPKFFNLFNRKQQTFALMHEMCHYIFWHFRYTEQGRDPIYSNIACDVAINTQLLSGRLIDTKLIAPIKGVVSEDIFEKDIKTADYVFNRYYINRYYNRRGVGAVGYQRGLINSDVSYKYLEEMDKRKKEEQESFKQQMKDKLTGNKKDSTDNTDSSDKNEDMSNNTSDKNEDTSNTTSDKNDNVNNNEDNNDGENQQGQSKTTESKQGNKGSNKEQNNNQDESFDDGSNNLPGQEYENDFEGWDETTQRQVSSIIKNDSNVRSVIKNIEEQAMRAGNGKLLSKCFSQRDLVAPVEQVNWQVLFRQMVLKGSAYKKDYSFARPNRHNIAIQRVSNSRAQLPNNVSTRPLPNVHVYVDTSGSVSDYALTKVLYEVQQVFKICSCFNLEVTPFNDTLGNTCVSKAGSTFDISNFKFKRGFTRYSIIWNKYFNEGKAQPDICIIITDGMPEDDIQDNIDWSMGGKMIGKRTIFVTNMTDFKAPNPKMEVIYRQF